MSRDFKLKIMWILPVMFAGSVSLFAQTAPKATPSVQPTSAPAHVSARKSSPYRPLSMTQGAKNYYQFTWGVDSFQAKTAESGQMVRFSYRVVDPGKAKALNDKKSNPFLLDEAAKVKLVVPTMEKIGELRQSSTPEVGKTYWMVFSNKGGHVKRGDRVSVVIGKFKVDGLVVQ